MPRLMSMNNPSAFAQQLLAWFVQHGRKDLPWQQNPTPYRVWVSEIMLQQTQVNTVIPYYQKFMQAFPDLLTLANAPQDAVLHHWSGLGYYARARNLHQAAQQCVQQHNGIVPDNIEQLTQLAGIGLSTAAAILALAHQQQHSILDGNVKRVLSRYHCVAGWSGNAAVQKKLWPLAQQHTPATDVAAYTQAIMDLGATVCTRHQPQCACCPLAKGCQAYQQQCVADYPAPKPRKTLPYKKVCLLMLETQNGAVFLHKRPNKGIWGGLWSFIEYPDNLPLMQIIHWCRQQFNIDIHQQQIWPEYQHSLTHFHMLITPVHLRCAGDDFDASNLQASGWYDKNQLFIGGMAAPVQQLLIQLRRTS